MGSTVKDVMSTHVIAVSPNAPYKEMAVMLHEQRVSAFPVVDDDNKVIGMVSETDMLAKEALQGTVPRTMQPSLTTRAARLMFDQRVKRLVVTSDDGTLIGIVSRSDVLSVYSRPDAQIRHQVTQDLILGPLRCDPERFTVTVKNGVVTIEGTPETSRAGHDIIDAVRHMEGVVFVRDRLSYPDDSPYGARVAR